MAEVVGYSGLAVPLPLGRGPSRLIESLNGWLQRCAEPLRPGSVPPADSPPGFWEWDEQRSGLEPPEFKPLRPEELTPDRLADLYLDSVFRYVSRRISRREDAEDITADVFAAAFEGLQRFRGDCPPYYWLLGIARRKIALALRRSASHRESLTLDMDLDAVGGLPETRPGADPEAAFERSEKRRVLRDLVSRLKPEHRDVLLMKYVEGFSIAEIAVVIGRSEAAATSLLKRAREALLARARATVLAD